MFKLVLDDLKEEEEGDNDGDDDSDNDSDDGDDDEGDQDLPEDVPSFYYTTRSHPPWWALEKTRGELGMTSASPHLPSSKKQRTKKKKSPVPPKKTAWGFASLPGAQPRHRHTSVLRLSNTSPMRTEGKRGVLTAKSVEYGDRDDVWGSSPKNVRLNYFSPINERRSEWGNARADVCQRQTEKCDQWKRSSMLQCCALAKKTKWFQ